MINFLSEKNKKEVKSEYSLRVISTFLIALSLTMVFVCVFLIPAHILSIYRKAVISDQLTMIKSSSLNQTSISLSEVKRINEIVKVLTPNITDQKPLSDYVKSVLNVKNRDITISSISVDSDVSQNPKIILKGLSKTRDGLTRFAKDIKSLNIFSSVDLPISSLVKSSDIDFVITLILIKQ